MARKALITGVGGQDGAYLARLLLEKGYEVHGTSRDIERTSFVSLETLGIQNRVRLHSVALGDFSSVLNALATVTPDEVYHLAGQSSVGLSFEQPIETFESITIGTFNILEAIRFLKLPIRCYHAGSGEAFGDTADRTATTSWPFRPRSPYGVAKAAACLQVTNYREAYGLEACSGILFNHESPLRPERYVTQKIVRAACRIAKCEQKKLKLGNIDVRRDWGWAPEYVEAMWRMLQHPTPQDLVIATGHQNSLKDFVAAVFASLGMDWQEHVEIEQTLMRPCEIAASAGDPSMAHDVLGWRAQYVMQDVAQMMVEACLNSPTK